MNKDQRGDNGSAQRITVKDWAEGARLRTLPAAAAPVILGVGGALHLQAFSLGKAALALLVALSLQIGVNFANDYSDGVRGTDDHRVGPQRLTASGKLSSRSVLALALAFFLLAAAAGLTLVAWSHAWWLLAVGALAIVSAWFYTGGRSPYGYLGWGISEILVFVFFGLVATIGTAWVIAGSAPAWLWWAASGMGLCSVALLMVNNIRDISTDSKCGKTTLAVRLGQRPSRYSLALIEIFTAICAAVALWLSGTAVIVLVSIIVGLLLLGTAIWVPVLQTTSTKQMLTVLRNAGLYTLFYGVVVGAALALSQS